jgi:hypothetical protein
LRTRDDSQATMVKRWRLASTPCARAPVLIQRNSADSEKSDTPQRHALIARSRAQRQA